MGEAEQRNRREASWQTGAADLAQTLRHWVPVDAHTAHLSLK